MYEVFFHQMKWENDVYIMYIVWLIFVPLLLYITRCIYNKVRPTKLSYDGGRYYMVRDLFLNIAGMEYLILASVLYSIYLGFWAWSVNPFSVDWGWPWDNWVPYLIVLPQVLAAALMVVLFFIRYTKFRKPLIR